MRRRARPAAAAKPVPNSNSDDGSGTDGGVTVPAPEPTFPVLPFAPRMSEAKKNPPALPIKFETLTPAPSVTVKDSGPGLVTEAPGPQLMPAQLTEYSKLPKVDAEVAPVDAKPGVRKPIVMAGFPVRFQSRDLPAPVATNPSAGVVVFSVSVTVTTPVAV